MGFFIKWHWEMGSEPPPFRTLFIVHNELSTEIQFDCKAQFNPQTFHKLNLRPI